VQRLRAAEQRGRGVGAARLLARHAGAGSPGGRRGAAPAGSAGRIRLVVGGPREGQGGRAPAAGRPELAAGGLGAGQELQRGGGLRRREAVVGAALDGAGDRRRHGAWCWFAVASWESGRKGKGGRWRERRGREGRRRVGTLGLFLDFARGGVVMNSKVGWSCTLWNERKLPFGMRIC
jgi:hypothetical protein